MEVARPKIETQDLDTVANCKVQNTIKSERKNKKVYKRKFTTILNNPSKLHVVDLFILTQRQ